MDQMKKIRLVSNSFYNAGLERAHRRDLTGAIYCLKKCLNLNKYQVDARNLLGLIYYEMGEVSEALVQWVISMNFQEENNRADFYLEQIQRKQERLDIVSQNVKKYNLALSQARSGSDDLAVLSLTRVVESNPRFVKAHLLLALLYIIHEDYTKAGKSLYKVLQIDRNNAKANWYMSIVKARTGKAEIERKKIKNAFSHRQMQDDDVIIPPSYKENTGLQTILNIGAGLLLGAAVIFFLVMPAMVKRLNNQHVEELKQYNEQLAQKNGEIEGLNQMMAGYENDKEYAEQQLDTYLNSSDNEVSQYAILVKMMQARQGGNLTDAVMLYPGFDPSLFMDETVRAVAEGIKQDIETNGYETLEELAYTMWSAGRMGEAVTYYQTCLTIRPDNPAVILNLGMINRAQNQTDAAVELFTQIVTQYADSEQAARASQELAELAPQTRQTAVPGQSIVNRGEGVVPESTAGAQETEAGAGESESGGEGEEEGGNETGAETVQGREDETAETRETAAEASEAGD